MTAKKYLIFNDDFEYMEVNGTDVPTYDSIAKVMEEYHKHMLNNLKTTLAPTLTMRIVKSKEPMMYIPNSTSGGSYKIYKETHQQLWVDSDGNSGWRNVPTVEE